MQKSFWIDIGHVHQVSYDYVENNKVLINLTVDTDQEILKTLLDTFGTEIVVKAEYVFFSGKLIALLHSFLSIKNETVRTLIIRLESDRGALDWNDLQLIKDKLNL